MLMRMKQLPDDIVEQWKKDAMMDATDLTKEGMRLYDLHGKYLDYWTIARQQVNALKYEYALLQLEKQQFYLKGASKEQLAKGWVYPRNIGKIVQANLKPYMDADKELHEIDEKYDVAKTQLGALEYIMKSIESRSYTINKLIERERFTGGG